MAKSTVDKIKETERLAKIAVDNAVLRAEQIVNNAQTQAQQLQKSL